MPETLPPSDLIAEVGRRLLAVRIMLDVSQEAMAGYMGVERTGYTNYERGTRLAPAWAVIRLSHKLQLPLSDWTYLGQLAGIPFGAAGDLQRAAEQAGALIGAASPRQVSIRPPGAAAAPAKPQRAKPRRRTLHERQTKPPGHTT